MALSNDPNVEFWVYLSRGEVQRRNREVGMMASVRFLRMTEHQGDPIASLIPFIPNPDYYGVVGHFQHCVAVNYEIEYNFEMVRLRYYPSLPSRFSALFLFDDLADANEAGRRYSFLKTSDLMKVRPLHPHILCSYSRHDMEAISILRYTQADTGILSPEDWDPVARSYWSGEAFPGIVHQGQTTKTEPIWEILYDGALTFVD